MSQEERLHNFAFSFPSDQPYAVLSVSVPEGTVEFAFKVNREEAEACTLRVVCAWCKAELKPGAEPVSHGICPNCAESFADTDSNTQKEARPCR